MKFSIKDFFSKCDQIRSFLRIWSHLLKKSVIENFIFCAVKRNTAFLKWFGNFFWRINDIDVKWDLVFCSFWNYYCDSTDICYNRWKQNCHTFPRAYPQKKHKNSTRSFWALSVPDSFNLYSILFYIMNF